MRIRILATVFVSVLLAGCTDADWDRSLSKAGLADPPPAPVATPAAPVAAAPSSNANSAALPQQDDWCVVTAKAAAREARDMGFDEATQKRRADQYLRQCRSGG